MKVYVATAFPNKVQAQYWMGLLRSVGVEITHDWTTAEAMDPGQRGEETPLAEQQKHALADIRGVILADIVWVIAPPDGGTGMWFEMGLAAGLELGRVQHSNPFGQAPRVFVSGNRRSIFTSLFKFFDTHDGCFDLIKALASAEKDPKPELLHTAIAPDGGL